MLPLEANQRFSVSGTLGTGDASLSLKAAATGKTHFVTCVILTCITSAAQAVYVGDTSGTIKALSLAASFPQHSQAFCQLLEGLALTTGEALILKPAAAGPSFHIVVEGYTK